MYDIFQYLLKWSIALSVVFVFYRLVLRPLTFYQWNRRYLIAYSMLAFFIPFINLYTYVRPTALHDIRLVQYIPVINIQQQSTPQAATAAFNPLMVVAVLILAGSLVLFARLIMQWYSLRRIRRNAVPLYHPEANVYHVDENVIPFSFGDAIYVNTALHTEQELNDIILHEFVHVKQKHSFDIIWSEILCILNWYNPFAWLIRHAIRQNLEFIADQAVLNNGLDKKTYQYHLLKVIGSSQYSIANNFNFSSLKKRIAMMNRLKTARVHLVKFLFVLPLLAVLLVAFRTNDGWRQPAVGNLNNDTIKKPDPEDLRRMKNVLKLGYKFTPLPEFYKENLEVKEVAWSSDNKIVFYLIDGKREVYDSESADDLKKIATTYGSIPGVFPLKVTPAEPARPAEALNPPDAIIQEKLNGFYKRNPSVQAIMWRNDIVMIKKKDGSLETYVMSDDKEMAKFTDRYGKMPVSPPPPPPPPGAPAEPGYPKLPEGIKSLEEENDRITLTLTDGSKGVFDLKKPAEKAAFEKKYGTVIEISALPAARPKDAKASIPEVIEVPATGAKPAVIETPATKEKEEREHVLQLNSDGGGKVSLSVVGDEGEHIVYSDKILVRSGVPQWQVIPKPKPEFIYYINGKKSEEQNPKVIESIYKVSHAEVLSNVELLKSIGETKHTSIINLITIENVKNKSAYLSIDSKRLIEEVGDSEIINTMKYAEENPVDINVEGVPENEVLVTMTGGKLEKRDGRYYATPQVTGNVEIKIYRKVATEVKLINKRVFRVRMPGDKPVT